VTIEETAEVGRLTRRDFMQAGALGTLGVGLPSFVADPSKGAAKAGCGERACILIFNVGGPSQLDTFDMKPSAPVDVRGPFRPIRTRVPGLVISELFPHHAKAADKFSLVRSCYHAGPAVHDVGWQLLQTGRMFVGGVEAPHVGAAAACLRGLSRELPPHVVLPALLGRGGGNLPHGQAGGFLGSEFDPWVPAAKDDDRTALADRQANAFAGVVASASWPPPRDLAVNSPPAFEDSRVRPTSAGSFNATGAGSSRARAALDLSRESTRVRERYGHTRLGRCCLAARRLVEAGVRFVTINTFLTVFDEPSWDIHGTTPFSSFREMRDRVAPVYDQAVAALLSDLDERGMLSDTLVCSLSEFGRTPRINAAGGRDHWPQCFTVCFAGGGVQGGRVVGRSDALGAEPVERPVPPTEIVATMLHSLGLDPSAQLPHPCGTPAPFLEPPAQPIRELFV
jgi:hypothetical protein